MSTRKAPFSVSAEPSPLSGARVQSQKPRKAQQVHSIVQYKQGKANNQLGIHSQTAIPFIKINTHYLVTDVKRACPYGKKVMPK